VRAKWVLATAVGCAVIVGADLKLHGNSFGAGWCLIEGVSRFRDRDARRYRHIGLSEQSALAWADHPIGQVAWRRPRLVHRIGICASIEQESDELRSTLLVREDSAPQWPVSVYVQRVDGCARFDEGGGRAYLALLAGEVQRCHQSVVSRSDIGTVRDHAANVVDPTFQGRVVKR